MLVMPWPKLFTVDSSIMWSPELMSASPSTPRLILLACWTSPASVSVSFLCALLSLTCWDRFQLRSSCNSDWVNRYDSECVNIFHFQLVLDLLLYSLIYIKMGGKMRCNSRCKLGLAKCKKCVLFCVCMCCKKIICHEKQQTVRA